MNKQELAELKKRRNAEILNKRKAEKHRKHITTVSEGFIEKDKAYKKNLEDRERLNPDSLLRESRRVDESMNGYIVEYLSELYIDSLVIDEEILTEHEDKFKKYFYDNFSEKYDMTRPLSEQVATCHPFIQILCEATEGSTKARKGILNDLKKATITRTEKDEAVSKALTLTKEDAKNKISEKMSKLEPEIGPEKIRDSILMYVKDAQEINKKETENILELKKKVKEAIDENPTNEKSLTENYLPKELKAIKNKHRTEFTDKLSQVSRKLIYDVDKGDNLLSESVLYDSDGNFLVENALTETIIIQTLEEFNALYKL